MTTPTPQEIEEALRVWRNDEQPKMTGEILAWALIQERESRQRAEAQVITAMNSLRLAEAQVSRLKTELGNYETEEEIQELLK